MDGGGGLSLLRNQGPSFVDEFPSLKNRSAEARFVCSDGTVRGNFLLLRSWSKIFRSIVEGMGSNCCCSKDATIFIPDVTCQTMRHLLTWSLHGEVLLDSDEAGKVLEVLHLLKVSVGFTQNLVVNSGEELAQNQRKRAEKKAARTVEIHNESFDSDTEVVDMPSESEMDVTDPSKKPEHKSDDSKLGDHEEKGLVQGNDEETDDDDNADDGFQSCDETNDISEAQPDDTAHVFVKDDDFASVINETGQSPFSREDESRIVGPPIANGDDKNVPACKKPRQDNSDIFVTGTKVEVDSVGTDMTLPTKTELGGTDGKVPLVTNPHLGKAWHCLLCGKKGSTYRSFVQHAVRHYLKKLLVHWEQSDLDAPCVHCNKKLFEEGERQIDEKKKQLRVCFHLAMKHNKLELLTCASLRAVLETFHDEKAYKTIKIDKSKVVYVKKSNSNTINKKKTSNNKVDNETKINVAKIVRNWDECLDYFKETNTSCGSCKSKKFGDLMSLKSHLATMHYCKDLCEMMDAENGNCRLCLKNFAKWPKTKFYSAVHMAHKHPHLLYNLLPPKGVELLKYFASNPMPAKAKIISIDNKSDVKDLKTETDTKDNEKTRLFKDRSGPPALTKDSNFLNHCPLCGKAFQKVMAFRMHLCHVHYKDKLVEMFQLDASGSCPFCDKRVGNFGVSPANNPGMLSHVGVRHDKLKQVADPEVLELIDKLGGRTSTSKRCPVCPDRKTFKKDSELKSHLVARHFREEVLKEASVPSDDEFRKCLLCPATFSCLGDKSSNLKTQLAVHLGGVHGYLGRVLTPELKEETRIC